MEWSLWHSLLRLLSHSRYRLFRTRRSQSRHSGRRNRRVRRISNRLECIWYRRIGNHWCILQMHPKSERETERVKYTRREWEIAQHQETMKLLRYEEISPTFSFIGLEILLPNKLQSPLLLFRFSYHRCVEIFRSTFSAFDTIEIIAHSLILSRFPIRKNALLTNSFTDQRNFPPELN